jgi:serine/threonine-protein kinase
MAKRRPGPVDPPTPDFAERYRVLGRLGAGGMGRILLAEDLKLGRRVAIKVIREDFAGDAMLVERFWREAQAAAAIGHPNIVQVYEVAQTERGLPYIVMEALTGRDLKTELEIEDHLPLGRVVDIAGQVLFALAAAHRAGIVHRDLKPGNIFLARREVASLDELDGDAARSATVKLLDFGVSRILRQRAQRGANITAEGDVIGTVGYMAPEQLEGSLDVDGRADLYALGVILFECLVGRRPFGSGDGVASVMRRAFRRPAPPVSALVTGVPRSFDQVIARALADSPDDRYPDAAAFVEALRPFHAREAAEQDEAPNAPAREGDDGLDAEIGARVRRQLASARAVAVPSGPDGEATDVDEALATTRVEETRVDDAAPSTRAPGDEAALDEATARYRGPRRTRP